MSSARSLKELAGYLRTLPKELGAKIATKAAPVVTRIAETTFANQVTPEGVAWNPSLDGSTPSLVKSGALRKGLKYVAIGSVLRVVLPVKYAKYQIGRRPVLPRQNGQLPQEYRDKLDEIAGLEIIAHMDGAR
jgi:hypothetical protein